MVEYFPFSLKDQSRIHQFGKKVLRGLFLGYALYAVGIWMGDMMVADTEELEKMHPCKTKTSHETQRSLQKFLKPNRKPKVTYTDNSLKFGKACEDLSWNHCTSTPHRSETNGIAERAVRRGKEDTSAVLGMDENWWADSMECYTYLRNVTDSSSDGKTPYGRRFGEPLKGPIIPFGSLVEYHLRKTSQGSTNLERKSYLEYFSDMHCVRGEIGKGDIA